MTFDPQLVEIYVHESGSAFVCRVRSDGQFGASWRESLIHPWDTVEIDNLWEILHARADGVEV